MTLSGFDASCFTKLEAYAWALHHAEVLCFVHSPPTERTGPIAARALAVRDLLLADARALSSHGLIEPNRIASRTRVRSHTELAFDVMRLQELLYESWPDVSHKTALTLDDLKEYERLAFELLESIGRRNRPREVSEATVRRQRAFTLLVTAYNQVRRAVLFFRTHEGDADRFAPSLFGGRKNGNHRAREVQPAPVAPSGVRVAIDAGPNADVEPAPGREDVGRAFDRLA